MLSSRTTPLFGAAFRRSGSKFIAQPSWQGAFDLFMAPTVEDFVFRRALRLSEKNILAGARQAALVTNEAMRAGLRDDMSHLDALERGALTPALHAALDEEISQVRAGGAAKIQAALGELESESERLGGCVVYER